MRIAETRDLLSPAHQARYAAYYVQHSPQVRAPRWLPLVDHYVAALGATSVLDYGCGLEGNLAQHAAYPVINYDPGVPAWAVRPGNKADLVVCCHVLEHVEEPCLDAVLADLLWYARKAVVLIVSCAPSTKILPDGTPWHTCVHEVAWWEQILLDTITLSGIALQYDMLPSQLYQTMPTEFGCVLSKEVRYG